MSIFFSTPEVAWRDHIMASYSTPKWMEDSSDISDEIPLSKRELFGLIVLAHIRKHQFQNQDWFVGYNADDGEPNDGYVSDGNTKARVEHKLVPQMVDQPALEAILSTYAKYARLGDAYGNSRVLIIFANKATQGLIKVSSLRDEIQDDCPFDQVLLMYAVSTEEQGATVILHITEQYPKLSIAQVDFDITTGSATVPHCQITPL